ncbi:2-oxoacid-dependent dioxygenase [Selaginella moellendorffii]|uniref:2-oxoacid-dependent dioxygenase n=1 Tax=Selaginella moellendorffii TaxID=88036 RepID=D8SQZ0_SELML|nr:2-oxoacid-dependent dioxygenase [Selaginella moellendorffii]
MVHYFFNLPAKERMGYYSTDIYKSFRFSTESIASAKKKFWSDYLFQHCQPAVHEDDVPHADPGTITVLQQELGVEGLEINYNGQWIPVKPVEGALVINVADMLQILSNNKYKSAEHRVLVNTMRPRVSIASFYGPTDDKHIAPLEELLGDNPPVFKACLFREYMDNFYKNHLGTRNIEKLRILNN